MKIILESINFRNIEATRFGSKESEYCPAETTVNYTLIDEFNKLIGEYVFHEDIDNLTINDIRQIVSSEVEKQLKED